MVGHDERSVDFGDLLSRPTARVWLLSRFKKPVLEVVRNGVSSKTTQLTVRKLNLERTDGYIATV